MKMLLGLATLTIGAAALGGCQSEAQIRQTFRDTAIRTCVEGFNRQGGAPGLDANRVCSCSIDRIMQGKSASDLRNYQPGPADQQAAQQCAMEELQRMGGGAAPAGAPPAGAPGNTAADTE